MTTQKIKKTIDINAPKETVWNVLFDDRSIRSWYAEFSEGAYAITDWKVGSKVIFTDPSQSGLIGNIIINRPNEVVSVEYTGIFNDNHEDYESELAKDVKGGLESYRLSENNDCTLLSIECDMNTDFFETMTLSWEKALQKIKELSESAS